MILITGGTGFIGSHLIQQLLASGKSVRAIKRKHAIVPKILRNQASIEWVEADLLDYFSLQDAFTDITHVYHCAAVVSYASADKNKLMKTNVEGTMHVVNICLENHCRLLYVSSVAALGDNEKGKDVSEKTPWSWTKYKSNYSISKYEAEREVWRGISEGLEAIIVNPSVVIGASTGRSESGKIFELLEKGIPYYPAGGTGFIDVEDVVNIMIRLMDRSELADENYLLNNENLSYQALFSRYALASGKKKRLRLIGPATLRIVSAFLTALKALRITQSSITKEVAIAASKNSFYSNKKITDTLSYSFKPLDQSFQEIHASLSKTHSNGD